MDPIAAVGATGAASRAAADVPRVVGKVYTYVGAWIALCGGLSVLIHVEGNTYEPTWFIVKALEAVGLDTSWVEQVQVWLIAHLVVGKLAAGFCVLIYLCHCGGTDALSKRAPVTAALLGTIAIQAGSMPWWMLPLSIAAGAFVEWVKARRHSASDWSGSYPDVATYLVVQILTFVTAPLMTYAWFISGGGNERRDSDALACDPAPVATGAPIVPLKRG